VTSTELINIMQQSKGYFKSVGTFLGTSLSEVTSPRRIAHPNEIHWTRLTLTLLMCIIIISLFSVYLALNISFRPVEVETSVFYVFGDPGNAKAIQSLDEICTCNLGQTNLWNLLDDQGLNLEDHNLFNCSTDISEIDRAFCYNITESCSIHCNFLVHNDIPGFVDDSTCFFDLCDDYQNICEYYEFNQCLEEFTFITDELQNALEISLKAENIISGIFLEDAYLTTDKFESMVGLVRNNIMNHVSLITRRFHEINSLKGYVQSPEWSPIEFNQVIVDEGGDNAVDILDKVVNRIKFEFGSLEQVFLRLCSPVTCLKFKEKEWYLILVDSIGFAGGFMAITLTLMILIQLILIRCKLVKPGLINE